MDLDPCRREAHRHQINANDSESSGEAGDLAGLGLVERNGGIDPLSPLAHRSHLHHCPVAGDRSQNVDLPATYLQIPGEDLHAVLDEKTDSDLLGSPTDLSRG